MAMTNNQLNLSAAYDQEVQERVERVLRRHGKTLDELDLSEQACLTLVVFNWIIDEMPSRYLSELVQRLKVPLKASKDRKRTHSWIMMHWYRPLVRKTMENVVSFLFDRPPLNQPVLIDSQLRTFIEEDHMPWSALAWSAYNSPDPLAVAKCRAIYGADAWDAEEDMIQATVKPALFALLTHPYLTEAIKEEQDENVRHKLEEKVRGLSWEASEARNKHEKATKAVGNLKEENLLLRQQLTEQARQMAEQAQRMAELEVERTEDRKMFAEFTAMIHEIHARQLLAVQQGRPAQALPLSGLRVAVLGGDPIHPFVASLIEAFGGESRIYSGTTKIQQLTDAVLPDLLVVITTYLRHSHDDHIKDMRRGNVPIVYVNQKGIGAVRRALMNHIDSQSALVK